MDLCYSEQHYSLVLTDWVETLCEQDLNAAVKFFQHINRLCRENWYLYYMVTAIL